MGLAARSAALLVSVCNKPAQLAWSHEEEHGADRALLDAECGHGGIAWVQQ